MTQQTAPFALNRRNFTTLLISGLSLGSSWVAFAAVDQHSTGVPAYSSRPGAPYTVYLNVAGFNYTGDWGNDPGGITPGVTEAIANVPNTGTFNGAQQTQIGLIFARMAQSYIGLNVNVTTVDPAPAGMSDLQRQNYYDNTPNMMHTVIGSGLRNGTNWQGSGDGVSGINVIAGLAPTTAPWTGTAPTTGPYNHTNWMFTEAQTPGGNINGDYIGAVAAHENGHAFGLYHQGDWDGGTKVNEYGTGDDGATATTPGSYVPILGNASERQRVTWRVGSTGNGLSDNDLKNALTINNPSAPGARGMTTALAFVDSGIGHTFASATPLTLNGSAVNPLFSQGVIVPKSSTDPNPIGEANYTEDWFSFTLDGSSTISLTANNSTQFLQTGVADGVGTLRSKLSIWDGTGLTLIGSGMEAVDTLTTTFSSTLAAGSYFARIGSFGGHNEMSAFNPAQYYDMGAYFLTGSGFTPVPEPGSFVLLGMTSLVFIRRRRA